MSDLLLHAIAAIAPTRVLDLGCGNRGSHIDLPGFPTLAAAYPGIEIVGYELDPARLGSPAPYAVCHGGALPLPEPALSFDLIAAINVLEHARDLKPVLAEILRLLAPGGHLLIAVPEGRALSDRLYRSYTVLRHRRRDHLRAWPLQRWREELSRATGFAYVGALDKVENLEWAPAPLGAAGRWLIRAAEARPELAAWRHLLLYGYLMLWEARCDREALLGELEPEATRLLDGDGERDDRLQALCELLRERVPHYDWVGFYLVPPDEPGQLVLGPFCGAPTEHVRIGFGHGVCGQAAEREETVVVPDVRAEGNYIACSLDVRSEIVVPLFKDGAVIGELDLDSHTVDAFVQADRNFLERIAEGAARLF